MGSEMCIRDRPVVYLKLEYTTGIKLASVACARGKRVSPGVLARLGSTIAFMKAPDHANTRLLIFCSYEVHAANKTRWYIEAERYHGYCTGIHCAKRRAHVSPRVPAHGHVPWLVFAREVRAANERRWCIWNYRNRKIDSTYDRSVRT